MGGLTRIQWHSFRRRLAAAAAFNLILTVIMVAILVVTARSARDVVEDAQLSQLRTRAFSSLQFAADRYQQATYAMLRLPSEDARRDSAMATAEFDVARARVRNLPWQTPAEHRANQRIDLLSENLRQMMDHLPEIVEDVDAEWREGGSVAAMRSIRRQSEPYFRLIDGLRREVELSGKALRASTVRANHLQRAVGLIATVALIAALLATVTVFVLIIARLGPALRQLEHGVRAFADGNTGHRIALGGHDELTRLSDAFDEMAAQIGEQQDRLRWSANTLEKAVAERTADLADANALLAAVDQRRRIFFAEVSHELRTPITIIHGEAEVALREAQLGKRDASDSLARIISQSREMRRLINDLFLIARAEADGLELHLDVVDVGGLLSQVANDFQAIATDTGVMLRAMARPGLVVVADAGRLRQVIVAGVDNAMRHGGAGVTIELVARQADEVIEIEIRDDGPGVSPNILPTLLQRFRRGQSGAEGAGLGLTIVRALVEAHKGQVKIVNRQTGGLILRVTLPAVEKA